MRQKNFAGEILYSLTSNVTNLVVDSLTNQVIYEKYLVCNGQLLLRSAYSLLFLKLGTYYGAGDGSTTFQAPDFQGLFLRGIGTNTHGNNASASPLKKIDNTNYVGTSGFSYDSLKDHLHTYTHFSSAYFGYFTVASTIGHPNVYGNSPSILTGRASTETKPASMSGIYAIRFK